MTHEYLSPKTKTYLQLSDSERIEKLRNPIWIGYERACDILDQLEDLLKVHKTHRMPNLLIVGDTNNGKTMIVNLFADDHPPHDNLANNTIEYPVLLIQAPPVPDEGRFYNTILQKLFASFRLNDRVDKKQYQVLQLLKTINTKMLIIDEVQHILAGNMNKQRHFLNTIKYLGNELQIPIVGVGTKEAFNAIHTDPQLANRFEPCIVRKWKNDEQFRILLASFESVLPLKKPSELSDSNIATKILHMSEGTIGEISTLLRRSAIFAIKNGIEKINMEVLSSIEYTSPSDRKWRVR